jgi:hypothetical protein
LSTASPVDVTSGKAGIIGRKLDIDRGEFRWLSGPSNDGCAAELLILLLWRAAADLQRRPDRPRRPPPLRRVLVALGTTVRSRLLCRFLGPRDGASVFNRRRFGLRRAEGRHVYGQSVRVLPLDARSG